VLVSDIYLMAGRLSDGSAAVDRAAPPCGHAEREMATYRQPVIFALVAITPSPSLMSASTRAPHHHAHNLILRHLALGNHDSISARRFSGALAEAKYPLMARPVWSRQAPLPGFGPLDRDRRRRAHRADGAAFDDSVRASDPTT
jgi:hypothetical protein